MGLLNTIKKHLKGCFCTIKVSKTETSRTYNVKIKTRKPRLVKFRLKKNEINNKYIRIYTDENDAFIDTPPILPLSAFKVGYDIEYNIPLTKYIIYNDFNGTSIYNPTNNEFSIEGNYQYDEKFGDYAWRRMDLWKDFNNSEQDFGSDVRIKHITLEKTPKPIIVNYTSISEPYKIDIFLMNSTIVEKYIRIYPINRDKNIIPPIIPLRCFRNMHEYNIGIEKYVIYNDEEGKCVYIPTESDLTVIAYYHTKYHGSKFIIMKASTE